MSRTPKFGPARTRAVPRPVQPRWSRPSVPPAVIGWTPYNTRGIAPSADPGGTGSVHIGGHVNAVIALGARDVLVGTDTGGVWHLAPTPGVDNVRAYPLSDDWDNPDVLCLTAGPDGDGHAYAGCRSLSESLPLVYTGMPVVYEAAPNSPGSWAPILDSVGFGSVYGIGIADGRRIVAATTSGVWWSAIPLPGTPLNSRAYSWQAAQWPGGMTGTVGCTSVVIANGRPVVSAGAGATIWTGAWDSRGALVMTQAYRGLAGAGRSSLAICTGQPTRLWCVAAGGGGPIAGVFSSADAGASWTQVDGSVVGGNEGEPDPTTLAASGGSQGSYNNCIAVNPVDARILMIGWQNGILVSTDAGVTYRRWSGNIVNLHKDLHALYFDPRDPTGNTLFIGSDGGLASSTDLGRTFSSSWNRSLADLQFASVPCHNGYGGMSVSPVQAGRLVAGLQDNGIVWGSGSGPWRTIGYGDGAVAIVLSDDNVLSVAQGGGAELYLSTSTGYSDPRLPRYPKPDGTLATVIDGSGNDTGNPAGLPDSITEAVAHPGHAGPPVMALGGNGPDQTTVFGLRYNNPDGSDSIWARLASLPADVAFWSAGAADDAALYVGTTPPHVFRLDLSERGWTPTDLAAMPTLVAGQPDVSGTVTRIVVLPDGSLLVAYNESPYTGGCTLGQVLHFDPVAGTWTRLSGPGTGLDNVPIFGLEADPWGVLYASTDDKIYVANGVGQPWHDMSVGLPRRAHLGHLRFARYDNGGIALFAGTWGRSAWKATWYRPQPPKQPGRGSGPGLTYNHLIGSLADGRLYNLTHGGLHPVGPIDPELERAARAAGATLVGSVAALHNTIWQTGERLNDADGTNPSAAAALAHVEALHNQLARGLGTLTTISESPQSWPVRDLERASVEATALVSQAADRLAAAGKALKLPATLATAVHTVVAASVEHAAAAAKLDRAVLSASATRLAPSPQQIRQETP